MLVLPNGLFLTQRAVPRLALVEARLGVDVALDTPPTPELGEQGLTLHDGSPSPTMEPLSVPLVRAGAAGADAVRTITLWGDKYPGAVDQGDAAAEWCAAMLNKPGVRLVYMDDDACLRHVPAGFPVEAAEGEETDATTLTTFADGFPILLANEASLEDLNSHMEAPVPMDRFRANIIVKGVPAWHEDWWARVTIGPLRAFGVKRCSRCVLPTTDQATAEQGGIRAQPVPALRKIRREPLTAQTVTFGINLRHSWPSKHTLKVGAPVSLELAAWTPAE